MRIGELARGAGLSPKTLRFYEGLGLLPAPRRTRSGCRTYDDSDISRLDFIRTAKRLRLSLEDIKRVLQIHDRKEPTCLRVRGLLDEKLAQVDAVLRDLRMFRKDLAMLRERASGIEDCRPAGGRICGIIENSMFGATTEALDWLRRGGRKPNWKGEQRGEV